MRKELLRFTRHGYLLALALLYGCGGGNSGPASYVGNMLVVDGDTYSDAAHPGDIVPGEIIVTPKEGMREEVRALVQRFGLRIAQETGKVFLVTVPLGFERQWADAFRRQGAVASAETTPV